MRALLDLLFPPRCPGCRQLFLGESPLCRPCSETLADVAEACCTRCGEPEIEGECVHCREKPPAFERVCVPFLHGGALAEAVHRFKYEDCPHLAVPLAKLLAPRAREELAWCSVLVPVSLHARRLRQRGYDQALLLARELGRMAGKPVPWRAVRRMRDTPPQVGRDRARRVLNVQGAFVAQRALVEGQRVLLVDDVLTTGATADAAATALREASAGSVRVLALARAP